MTAAVGYIKVSATPVRGHIYPKQYSAFPMSTTCDTRIIRLRVVQIGGERSGLRNFAGLAKLGFTVRFGADDRII